MVAKITNIDEVERRYPREVVRAITSAFVERIREVVDDPSAVFQLSRGYVRVTNMLSDGMSLSKTSACVEILLKHIAASKGVLSLAAMEITVERRDGGPHTKVIRIPASEASMHIAHARQVLDAMAQGHLALARQPVFNVDEQGRSLYDECLARVLLPDAHCAMMPASFIPSVEHAQLMHEFDQIVVTSVIDRLVADETLVLGCNISAGSALISPWWMIIFDRLRRLPEVAHRLIIEITETAPVVPPGARDFLRYLHGLGCRVAIDDFGSHYGVQNAIRIGAPDIVKLDAFFLREAKDSTRGVERLHSLATLARRLAHTVIIEGMEDSGGLEIARRIGCEWAQGYLRSEVESAMMHRRTS
ncbi:EAL domain-containing protein [Paraburkholderia antibiotica]|uniref:EAL domain-containing protein n=1 Tax=Paraburkholderia antibiotica TaxID=2728839 RepID=A0A7Y0FGG4_9BURK|nr:EAL domain-containing protein [Paraburkholderia antibiotica]NML35058.1 EAL domain-containing protein [Paraburkholderia antibiotica]